MTFLDICLFALYITYIRAVELYELYIINVANVNKILLSIQEELYNGHCDDTHRKNLC